MMKSRRFYIIILICVYHALRCTLASSTNSVFPEELNERFVLLTDRNYYAVTEILHFKAINNSHFLVKQRHWSNVFYVELVTSKGIPVFRGKYELSAVGADGDILIPPDLTSGNYYLIGYTKWNRNFSPLDFAFAKLCIINPEKAFIIDNSINKIDSIKTDPVSLPVELENIDCRINKSTYSKREEVSVSFRFPKTRDTLSHSYCISVVKKAAIDPENFGIISSGISSNTSTLKNNFIPEIYGTTISGSIVGIEDSVPYPDIKVHLSVLGNRFDYLNSKSDSEGRFVFSLQQSCNKHDMYISFEPNNQLPARIMIDNEYFSGTFSFPGYPFTLSPDQEKIAEEIMFNMQVNKAFNRSETGYPCDDTITSDFYGKPSKTIYIDDYVELPNLREVFFELLPEVMIQKKKGETYLQAKGRIENLIEFQMYKPLVFVDRLPVTDIEELLTISPTSISHIELVNEIYIKGDNRYGGIISIHSKEGNLAGIRLPDNSIFFNYNGYSNNSESEVYSPAGLQSHHPDYRNCLFWEPDFLAKSGTEDQIKFHTTDVTGDYVVLIRGLSEEGKIITGSIDFRVE